MVIIGLCGFQGSGKDTFANYLVQNHNFIKLSFASAVKDVLNILFDWNRELIEGGTIESREFRETTDLWWSEKLHINNLTPRKMLQFIGTDLFRDKFNADIWTLIVENKIKNVIQNNIQQNIIISDCRFPNEIAMIKKYNGILIHIQRNNLNQNNIHNNSNIHSNIHSSEIAWIGENFDLVFDNNFDNLQDVNLGIDAFYNETIKHLT